MWSGARRKGAGAMSPAQANHRILMSRTTLFAWRQQLPAGRPEDALRMIGEEIAALERIATAFSDKSESVNILIDVWRDLDKKARSGMN